MTQPSKTEHRVLINEGTVKKNLNPPPVGIRPPPPKAQVAVKPKAQAATPPPPPLKKP